MFLNAFTAYSGHHLLAIFTYLVLPLFLIGKFSDKIKDFSGEKYIRYSLVAIAIGLELWFYTYRIGAGYTWEYWLPFQFCGWVLYLSVYEMFTKNDKFYTLHMIMLFAAVLSLLAPDFTKGINHLRFHHFFIVHCFHIVSFYYLYKVNDLRPTRTKLKLSYFILIGISLFFVIFDQIMYAINEVTALGSNYWFMLKPAVDGIFLFDIPYSINVILYDIVWIMFISFVIYIISTIKIFEED